MIKLIVCFVFVLVGCKEAPLNEIDYCKMLELDQSYVPTEGISKEEAISISLKREEIFKNNFSQLIKYSIQNGFPDIESSKSTGLDSCKYWAIVATLFHVGQSQPSLFFESETIEVFKKEI